jgi:hypothetical protein
MSKRKHITTTIETLEWLKKTRLTELEIYNQMTFEEKEILYYSKFEQDTQNTLVLLEELLEEKKQASIDVFQNEEIVECIMGFVDFDGIQTRDYWRLKHINSKTVSIVPKYLKHLILLKKNTYDEDNHLLKVNESDIYKFQVFDIEYLERLTISNKIIQSMLTKNITFKKLKFGTGPRIDLVVDTYDINGFKRGYLGCFLKKNFWDITDYIYIDPVGSQVIKAIDQREIYPNTALYKLLTRMGFIVEFMTIEKWREIVGVLDKSLTKKEFKCYKTKYKKDVESGKPRRRTSKSGE